jgi:hypothetical protein
MKRQGDILFIPVTKIPENAKKLNHGVIAEGEITGHKHQIAPGSNASLLMENEQSYIEASEETNIVHEEHNTVKLEPGNWEVRRQKTYEPKGWQRVED